MRPAPLIFWANGYIFTSLKFIYLRKEYFKWKKNLKQKL
nr:MAG TPA: hypothetical protein [Caudoviricetes sp.]